MSRGIALRPDEKTSAAIRSVWDRLSAQGLPSMSTHTHGLHQPHVSLIVAEDLPVDAALRAVGSVPQAPIRLLVESVGVFPGGFLFMACVSNQALFDEQRRVYEAMLSLVSQPWPYFEPATWTPHVTTG